MQISYLGHSSFRLKTKSAQVITDPFSAEIGFKMPKVEADIVTISHGHFDHNCLDSVKGEPFVMSGAGEYEIKEVSVLGTTSFHDLKKGEERGENTIYTISAEELTVCHLGDLGHVLTSKKVEEIGEVDVLLIPVGGEFTIGPKRAVEVVRQLEPKLVVPMHYKTKRHDPKKFAKILPVDDFLKQIGVEYREEEKLVLTKASIEGEMEVIVLRERS